MSRLSKTFTWLENRPEYLIQVFLSTALFVTGVYIAGPWYVGGNTTAIGVLSDSALGHTLIGLFYASAGAVAFVGVVLGSAKARYWGTMALFGGFMFMTLLRIFSIGFTPIIWVLILTLALISGVLHIIESRRRASG